MTTAYFPISIFKDSKIPPEPLKNFLSYVNQKALKEYLYISDIYKGKKNFKTIELIDLIINCNENNKDTYGELTMDKVNIILTKAQS